MSGIRRVGVGALVAAWGWLAVVAAQDALADLGIRERAARDATISVLTDSYLPTHLGAKAFKAATPEVRATMVKGLAAWASAHTRSPEFAAAYAKTREANRPESPAGKPSVDEEIAKMFAEQRKGIEDMRKSIPKMPAEMRAEMEKTVKGMEAEVSKNEKDAKYQAMLRQGLEMQRAEEQRRYDEQVKEFEKRYPADPAVAIASRLREFLEVSKDVDFSAKLVPANGLMKFADARYERKSDQWKLCYRAGKEAVDAARAAAAEWLSQAPKQGGRG